MVDLYKGGRCRHRRTTYDAWRRAWRAREWRVTYDDAVDAPSALSKVAAVITEPFARRHRGEQGSGVKGAPRTEMRARSHFTNN